MFYHIWRCKPPHSVWTLQTTTSRLSRLRTCFLIPHRCQHLAPIVSFFIMLHPSASVCAHHGWIGSWVTRCYGNCYLPALGPGTAFCFHFLFVHFSSSCSLGLPLSSPSFLSALFLLVPPPAVHRSHGLVFLSIHVRSSSESSPFYITLEEEDKKIRKL